MSNYFGLFVTSGCGRIKSYNGNFYKLNKLEDFSPQGSYIDDYFKELSPHEEDLFSSFDIMQASMAKNASMLPTSFRSGGEAIFSGHISSSVTCSDQHVEDTEITWYFGGCDQNGLTLHENAFSSPVLQWAKAVSHEVNNPLQVLTGLSHMIKLVDSSDPKAVERRMRDIEGFIEKSTEKISSSVNYMNIITRQDPREFELLDVGFVVKLFRSRLKDSLRLSVKTNIDELSQIHASVRLLETMFSLFINYFDKIKLRNKSVSCDIRSSDSKLRISVSYNQKGMQPTEICSMYHSPDYVELPLCAIQELCRMLSGKLYKGSASVNRELIIVEIPLLNTFSQ